MIYVKKSAQILLVDDSEAEKYKQKGFEVWTPPEVVPDFGAMTVDEIKAYAEGKGVDLGDATKKDDIIAKLKGGQ